jgi:hypothetical protein
MHDLPDRIKRDGPSKGTDPADCHSGEGTESMRAGLKRTLAEWAQRHARKRHEATSSRIPLEPAPEPETSEAPPR